MSDKWFFAPYTFFFVQDRVSLCGCPGGPETLTTHSYTDYKMLFSPKLLLYYYTCFNQNSLHNTWSCVLIKMLKGVTE